MTLASVEQGQTLSVVAQGFIGAGIAGEALLLFHDSSVREMAGLLEMDQRPDPGLELGLLMDAANLLIGACLNGIAEQLDIRFSQGQPPVLGRHARVSEVDEAWFRCTADGVFMLRNRAFTIWEQAVANELQRYQRTGQVASLVLFDIDRFKKVNDTYAHPAGDAVIREVARALRESTRQTDVAGRYGGEEFGIVLIDTDGQRACVFAERLRARVEGTVVEHEGTPLRVTISLGIAELSPQTAGAQQWIERADAALYASKHGGRNRCALHGD